MTCISLLTNNPSTDFPRFTHPLSPFTRLGPCKDEISLSNNTLCFSNHSAKKQQNDKKWQQYLPSSYMSKTIVCCKAIGYSKKEQIEDL